MARERHTAAFVVGTVLGGLAGAAAALWHVPQSGAETRAKIGAAVEDSIFKLLGMDERESATIAPAAGIKRESSTVMEPSVLEPPEQPEIVEEEPVTMPATFRGEPLADLQNDEPSFRR